MLCNLQILQQRTSSTHRNSRHRLQSVPAPITKPPCVFCDSPPAPAGPGTFLSTDPNLCSWGFTITLYPSPRRLGEGTQGVWVLPNAWEQPHFPLASKTNSSQLCAHLLLLPINLAAQGASYGQMAVLTSNFPFRSVPPLGESNRTQWAL